MIGGTLIPLLILQQYHCEEVLKPYWGPNGVGATNYSRLSVAIEHSEWRRVGS